MPSGVDTLSQLLDDILDDLSARFIINLPQEELSSVTRICFGLEQAHWFYEDFFRPQHPKLPSVNLRAFTAALFSHCPLLWKFSGQHEAAFDDFLKYKIRVPVRGAIMLNEDMTKCVLVKGWKASAGWGFPKGKIDQQEADHDCAIREVREECGFDLSPYVKEEDFIDIAIKEQSVRLYVVSGVPLDTKFEPQTRKEISKIDWFTLNDLPTYKKTQADDAATNAKIGKFYMVAPFLGPLRRWIKRQRPSKNKKGQIATSNGIIRTDTPVLEEEKTMATRPQYADSQDVDAPSQALKLLLGIADVPKEGEETSEIKTSTSNAQLNEIGGIDLASLFIRKDVSKTPNNSNADPRPLANNKVPINLLNTSIEASILDQLRPSQAPVPADNQAFQSLEGRASSYRPSPLLQHQQLPPWMAQQSFTPFPPAPQHANPNGFALRPPPFMKHDQFQRDLPSIQHMPLPPSNLHMLQNNRSLAAQDNGPPGLLNKMQDISQPKKTINPNASSLLALLKPSSAQSIPIPPMQNTHSHPSSDALVAGTASREARNASQANENQPPLAHKQSLLNLLKPATHKSFHGDASQIPNMDDRFMQNQHNIGHQNRSPDATITNSSRDEFLLNYLTQAAQGAR